MVGGWCFVWWYDDDDSDDVDDDDNDDKVERGSAHFCARPFGLQTGHCFPTVWRPPVSCLPKSHSTNRWLPLDKKLSLSNGKIAGRSLLGRFHHRSGALLQLTLFLWIDREAPASIEQGATSSAGKTNCAFTEKIWRSSSVSLGACLGSAWPLDGSWMVLLPPDAPWRLPAWSPTAARTVSKMIQRYKTCFAQHVSKTNPTMVLRCMDSVWSLDPLAGPWTASRCLPPDVSIPDIRLYVSLLYDYQYFPSPWNPTPVPRHCPSHASQTNWQT